MMRYLILSIVLALFLFPLSVFSNDRVLIECNYDKEFIDSEIELIDSFIEKEIKRNNIIKTDKDNEYILIFNFTLTNIGLKIAFIKKDKNNKVIKSKEYDILKEYTSSTIKKIFKEEFNYEVIEDRKKYKTREEIKKADKNRNRLYIGVGPSFSAADNFLGGINLRALYKFSFISLGGILNATTTILDPFTYHDYGHSHSSFVGFNVNCHLISSTFLFNIGSGLGYEYLKVDNSEIYNNQDVYERQSISIPALVSVGTEFDEVRFSVNFQVNLPVYTMNKKEIRTTYEGYAYHFSFSCYLDVLPFMDSK